MDHCLSHHHKLLPLPSPVSTLKPRSSVYFAPKSQALTSKLTVVAGASSHCEFSSLNSPLDPRTRSGKELSSVLQNHPQLFHVAVAQELKQLADERQDARCRMNRSAESLEACLHRRIARLKEQQCQIAVEDVMYLLIFYKFSEVKVPLVPKLSKCIYNDRLEILPAKDWELESIYSLEVLEMIREHVTTVIGLRANSSVTDNWAMTKITRQTLGRVYVASILYGYFLKSVSLRHRLERSLFLESQDLHLSCRTSVQEMSHGIKSLLFGHIGKIQSECVGSHKLEKTNGKLKCYVMGFDSETLQRCAKLRSGEAVNLIKNHCCALFGDDAEMASIETDEGSQSMADMAAKLMHAVQYENYGDGPSNLKHVEILIPSPKKGEVLIRLEAASLNPADWKIQKGMLRPLVPLKFPFIPAHDVAGEIVEVGQGVKKFKKGDKVVALLQLLRGGALAEFATASEKLTVSRPQEVSAAEGAGLVACGLTAYQALTQAGQIELDGTGQLKSILITGASGGVGHFAVQLAKLANTHVTVTCGAHNVEFVKSLGADEVLDYRTPDGEALRSPSGRKYDIVIHCAPVAIPWSVFEPNLSLYGKVIDITPGVSALITFVQNTVTFSKKKLVPMLMNAKAENLDYLLKLVKEGKLKTVIDSKHSLTKAEDAWAKSIDGHATGKIIVEA